MKLSTQGYKGTRDFYPEDMRLRSFMFNKWREACISFGYEEYDGPILEPLELYTSKTSEEIVNEQSYTFNDRGDRKVIMRPEMTPTVSRMVAAKRQEFGYPLRLFSIPNCFRYERPQKGRLREFWQLNADIFGVEGIEADVEIIQLADSVMKSFGAKPGSYAIKVNSRKLLDKRIGDAGPNVEVSQIIRLIDGFNKIKKPEFEAKLSEAVEKPTELYEFLTSDGDSEEVKKIRLLCKDVGVNVISDQSLARGFDYYTDIVFEVFDTNPENNRSMFGGGRYDGLVGQFGVKPVPTVGFGMGDVTLQNFLKSNNLLPKIDTAVDLNMILIGDVYSEANNLAQKLRTVGVNVSIDATDRKLEKKLKATDKQGVRYALFVGQDEIESGQYPIKDLVSGEEFKNSFERIVSLIKDYRKNP